MAFLCVLIFATAVTSIVRAANAVRRRRHPAGWWIAFVVLSAAGIGFAGWSLFYVTSGWQIGSNMRFIGFPVPAVVYMMGDDGWVAYMQARPLRLFIIFTDLLACAGFALFPLILAAQFRLKAK